MNFSHYLFLYFNTFFFLSNSFHASHDSHVLNMHDINFEIVRQFAPGCSIEETIANVKSLSLINRSNRLFFTETIDLIISFLSNQYNVSPFSIARLFKTAESRRWQETFLRSNPAELNLLFNQALLNENMDEMKMLIDHGVNVDFSSLSLSNPPLIFLTMNHKKHIAEFLLQHGANVNIQNADGETPFICSTKLGDMAMMQLLTKFNADKTLKDSSGRTALDWAMLLS